MKMKKKVATLVVAFIFSIIASTSVVQMYNVKASGELEKIQDNKRNLNKKISELDKNIELALGEVNENKKEMNKIAYEIKDTKLKVAKIEKKQQEEKKVAYNRVRAMYMSGSIGYLEVILGSKNLNDFISRVTTISKIMEYDKNIFEKLENKKQDIDNYKKKLDKENNKLESLKQINVQKLNKLNKDMEEQKELLAIESKKEKSFIAMNEKKEKAVEKAKEAASNNNVLPAGSTTMPSRGGSSIQYSKAFMVQATAYASGEFTASGRRTKREPSGYSTIAVDPRVIPLGTRVYVEGYGYAIAADTGLAIKGRKIDVFLNSYNEAVAWGRKTLKIYILK